MREAGIKPAQNFGHLRHDLGEKHIPADWSHRCGSEGRGQAWPDPDSHISYAFPDRRNLPAREFLFHALGPTHEHFKRAQGRLRRNGFVVKNWCQFSKAVSVRFRSRGR